MSSEYGLPLVVGFYFYIDFGCQFSLSPRASWRDLVPKLRLFAILWCRFWCRFGLESRARQCAILQLVDPLKLLHLCGLLLECEFVLLGAI
jgi:hypothetical protein